MTKNYARNIKTGEIIFFATWNSAFIRDSIENWAFFEIPSGAQEHLFRGHLIGESSDVRCARLQHRPQDKRCNVCNACSLNEEN